jgi:hypothetical protein
VTSLSGVYNCCSTHIVDYGMPQLSSLPSLLFEGRHRSKHDVFDYAPVSDHVTLRPELKKALVAVSAPFHQVPFDLIPIVSAGCQAHVAIGTDNIRIFVGRKPGRSLKKSWKFSDYLAGPQWIRDV